MSDANIYEHPAVKALQEENAELQDKVEQLELDEGIWPEWAEKLLKMARKRNGNDSQDDADGVCLLAEMEQAFDMVDEGFAIADRQNAALKARIATLEATNAAQAEQLAKSIHYPDCWDTMAYPTIESALHELQAWFQCSTEPCQSTPAESQLAGGEAVAEIAPNSDGSGLLGVKWICSMDTARKLMFGDKLYTAPAIKQQVAEYPDFRPQLSNLYEAAEFMTETGNGEEAFEQAMHDAFIALAMDAHNASIRYRTPTQPVSANQPDGGKVPNKPLSEKQIEAGWHKTFSTSNPFCPCDLRSFTKAVRWAENTLKPSAPIAEGDK